MNIVNHDLKFGRERERDLGIGIHVPYLRHVDEETVVTKSGLLLQVIRLSGLPYQTMDQAEINARLANRNMTVRSLGSSRFALYATIIRRKIAPAIEGDFDNPFADELNARYMDGLKRRTMFVNELYLTVIRRPMTGRAGKVDRMFDVFRMADNEVEARGEALRDLKDMVSGIAGDFRSYRPEILSCVTRDGGLYSEPAEFFAKILAAGDERSMPLPRMSLADYVGTGRIMIGRKAAEIWSADGATSKVAAMVSIKEYPPMTTPGQLDGLLRLPYEFIVTHSFAPEDRTTVTEAISTISRQIANSDDGGTAVEDDIETARDRLASGEVVFGKHHMTVAVLERDLSRLNRAVADVTAELARMGVVAVREDLNQEAAWWAQLPTNFSYIARQGLISSVNFAGLFSAHNFPSGQTQKVHWVLPISLLETTSQTAYFFNFHEADVGNFTAIGPTGSGKTVALSFLLAQGMRVHARRKFFELADVARNARRGKGAKPISPVALEAVKRIDALFAIERDINGLSAAERLAVRQEKSNPLLNDMEGWLRAERHGLSRSSPVAGPIDYILSRWTDFARYADDGRICMTNNAAERALRGVACGRKSWLFAGSDRGADRAAIMLTLIMTARLNDVDPKAWLADILARIADLPISRLPELLPWEWKRLRQGESPALMLAA